MKSNFSRIIGVGLTAVMLTSMLVTVAPVMALTAATVTTNNSVVGGSTGYWDVRFTVNTAIADAVSGGNITITFPSGFTVNQTTWASNESAVTIAAGPGWLSQTTFGDPILTVTASNASAGRRAIRVTLAAGDIIGADAQVRIVIPPGVVTNPSVPGSYNVTVVTSNETTSVTSNSFSITLPSVAPLPGIITAKNSAGDILYQASQASLAAAIATPGASRIELTAGTYNTTNTASVANQTIVGVGANGTVILTAGAAAVPLTISAVNVTIQDLVIQGNRDGTANLTSVGANNTTFKNVIFSGGVNQVSFNLTGATAAPRITIDGCTFNVTGNVSRGFISGNTSIITNSLFMLDSGATGILAATSINTTPTVLEVTAANVTITGNAFSGLGAGISVSGNGTATIQNNTFTGVGQKAIATTGGADHVGTVNVRDNTISGSGSTNVSTSDGVVTFGGGSVLMINNAISNSAAANYALHVSAGNITVRFNNITGNTLNLRQTGGTANATLNWWGTADGPATTAASWNVTDSNAVHNPHLKGSVSGGAVAFSTGNLSVQTTSGVDVSTANGTVNSVAAAKYAANPQTVAPPGTPVAYYDVNIVVTPGSEPGAVNIRFYTNVAANSKVYYGGGLTGAWTEASNQGVNMAGGYAFVTINSASLPSYQDMGGTPFVVTNVAPTLGAPALLAPAIGATSVPVNTAFSWSSVANAATYDWQLSTSATFATLTANVSGLTQTVYGLATPLAANTTYFWRVHAMAPGSPMGAWSVGTFTTAVPAAPTTVATPNITVTAPVVNIAAPPAPAVTVQAPPPAQVTVNPPAVTVQAPPPAQVKVEVPPVTQAIPNSILYVIIVIGAVLIIALIVLIVRTRRVA